MSLTPALAAGVVRALGLTLRLTIIGVDLVLPAWRARRPTIYALWHGRLLMVPWVSAKFSSARGARTIRVLASRSRDGEMVTRYVKHFGLAVVRGSSSRGGGAALRALVTALREGTDVAIVPDGPRGPREQLQAGVVALAGLTGAPVVPLAVAAHPARHLRSWDRFLVPLPFARCVLAFGPPVSIDGDAERERAGKDLERALAEVTARADRLAAGAEAS